jgi:hypothetical protein
MRIGMRFARELFRPSRGRSKQGDIRMKLKEITPKQSSSVSCPTCGVAAGERCVLLSGAVRFGPHTDRKLFAAEAMEKETNSRDRKPSRWEVAGI